MHKHNRAESYKENSRRQVVLKSKAVKILGKIPGKLNDSEHYHRNTAYHSEKRYRKIRKGDKHRSENAEHCRNNYISCFGCSHRRCRTHEERLLSSKKVRQQTPHPLCLTQLYQSAEKMKMGKKVPLPQKRTAGAFLSDISTFGYALPKNHGRVFFQVCSLLLLIISSDMPRQSSVT